MRGPFSYNERMLSVYEEFKSKLYDPMIRRTSFSGKAIDIYGCSLPSLGIPVPHVKEVVKEYLANPSLDLRDFNLHETVELTMAFFALGLQREGTFAEKMEFLRGNLKNAQSWGVTDLCPQYVPKKDLKEYLPFYRSFLKSRFLYQRRFAYVMAMGYYRAADVEPILDGLRYDGEYYVYMAQAWLLATLAITHFAEVVAFLKKEDCPMSLRLKTISKGVESFRLSEKQKKILKSLR